jgi:ubiquitin carboxyl-terminal hydrolase 14
MFTLQCAEAPEEQQSHVFDMFSKLSCHIGMETRFLVEGLRDAMHESLTKNSPSLGRDALYNKSWLISKLPYYCCVHVCSLAILVSLSLSLSLFLSLSISLYVL